MQRFVRNAVMLLCLPASSVLAAEPLSHAAGDNRAAGDAVILAGPGLRAALSADGRVVRLTGDHVPAESPTACLTLAGCRPHGEVALRKSDGTTAEFSRRWIHAESGRACRSVETFTMEADCLTWQVRIEGEDAAWSTPIETRLTTSRPETFRVWAAWGAGPAPTKFGWNDPLVPRPWDDLRLVYGGSAHSDPWAMSLPLVTLLSQGEDSALSLVCSPEDVTLDAFVAVSRSGEVVFTRDKLRISSRRPVQFTMHLVPHPADWRAALQWMVRRYPEFFESPNARAAALGGCGAYSRSPLENELDKAKRMGFRVNWLASFDVPYMGMFLPPVKSDDETWTAIFGDQTSIASMRAGIRKLHEAGLYTLHYFNVTEFGKHVKDGPCTARADDPELWKDAHNTLFCRFGDAVLRSPAGKVFLSWEGCVAMDPGEDAYRDFLLDQARRHIAAFPESAGICIDRMDWLRHYNRRRDDGVSWIDGMPARSLVTSWHDIMSKLGPIMHEADKVIYANPHYRRLDLMRHLDGVYDEFGQYGFSMNACAFLCLAKPLMEWTIDAPEFQNSPDSYLQRHLYMGAWPTAPLAGNDHCLGPADWAEKAFLDYGPLFDALRGRRWVLEPHALSVRDGKARANIFRVPDGDVIAVVMAEGSQPVTIDMPSAAVPGDAANVRVLVMHPGSTVGTPLQPRVESGRWSLDVPTVRGCALVKIETGPR
ncbi:MAG: hypothetical protein ACUVQK_15830 [Thermogutta sp.]